MNTPMPAKCNTCGVSVIVQVDAEWAKSHTSLDGLKAIVTCNVCFDAMIEATKLAHKFYNATECLVNRMFKLDDVLPQIRCPHKLQDGEQCDAVPHLVSTLMGRNIPPDSTSGPGLIIEWECENDHRWQLRCVDHSGGTWLSVNTDIKRKPQP